MEALDGKSAADVHNRLIKKIAKDRAAIQERTGQDEDFCDDCDEDDVYVNDRSSEILQSQDEKLSIQVERNIDISTFLMNVAKPWAHVRLRRK